MALPKPAHLGAQTLDCEQVAFGHVACLDDGSRRRPPARGEEADVRNALMAWMVVAALLLGLSLGRAADGDETTMTVQVSSSEHETDEGYFALGKDATVMAKPGSTLHRYLTRQNGRQVRITLTMVDGRQLSRIER
jgi:hypothetical protein